jgi:GNAT superfamily N-acetyltransferase
VVRATAGQPPSPPPGITVEEIGPDGIDVVSRVMADGWDLPFAQLAAHHRLALADPSRRQRLVLARYGGEPVGAAGLFVLERSVMLQAGVVLPAYRRRGLYAAMVHARLAIAAALGRELAISHARGDTSAPILAALGFEVVAHFRSYADP